MAAAKRTKAAPTDDIDELFEGIGPDSSKKASKPKPTSAAAKAIADQDILAELENELSAQNPPSRPHTPRVRDVAAGAKGSPAARKSVDVPGPRKSTESATSLRASFTPSATSSDLQESEKKAPVSAGQQQQPAAAQQGGGWWGSVFGAASAAMKTAEAAVKDLQSSEEAKKWTEQVKGNVTVLRGFGDELRHRALPTFTNILHTLAPPISSHERLHIHITHDLVGYPSLDPMIHDVFARVMSQVEGGDLLVIQRGQEMTGKRGAHDSSGWRDGPWWRAVDPPRDMGIVKGLNEGTKLCRANAEGYANEYFASRGGIEEARIRATEPLSSTNPVRTSDLFLSVQAVGVDADNSLFARTAAVEKEKEDSTIKAQDEVDELVCFAIFILDPVHEIEYSTISQTIPARWIKWLDALSPLTPTSGDDNNTADAQSDAGLPATTPEEIREIIEAGGVDPREWVAEWVEEALLLSTGIVAQRYVARRMGVGEGGIGRGKKRMEELVQDNAGEAARAGLI
ncbi:hypothetical protein jhhlp_005263 [Lomentospora prolificans]|uniref:Maintenance of telomere capping protein 1 n=1 Tax=Lomentospora prolificans TaxID=41688 RepID=A0A2N3N7A2_9PEZI|nr:hypothetical protein jhhlp_005263 [Lomentospora prolificans]